MESNENIKQTEIKDEVCSVVSLIFLLFLLLYFVPIKSSDLCIKSLLYLFLPPPLWSVKSDIHTDISAVWILFLPPVAENDIIVYDTLFWSEPSLFPRVSHLKSSWRRPLRLCRRTSEVDGMTDLIEAVGSDRTRRPSDRSSHVLRCSLWEARLWRRTCTDGQRGDQWRNLYTWAAVRRLFFRLTSGKT